MKRDRPCSRAYVLWRGETPSDSVARPRSDRSKPADSYLCDSVIDDLLISDIALVADEQLVDALGGVAVDLLQPLLHVVEGVHVGNIVDNADAVSATVVGRSDGSETLLTRGIPLLIG